MSDQDDMNNNAGDGPGQGSTPPTYLDGNGEPIPFFGQKNTGDHSSDKQGYEFGFFPFLGLITLFILLITFTPLYSGLMLITPDSIQKSILSPLHQNVLLSAEPKLFDKPFKMPIPAPETLPVLGFDSGICFSFPATIAPATTEGPNAEFIDLERIQATQRGSPIAEIIAVGAQDGYEYKLESVTYREVTDKDNEITSIICQKFGLNYASTPEAVSALYIRALVPFTALKTAWNTTKRLYNDNNPSPIESSYPKQ